MTAVRRCLLTQEKNKMSKLLQEFNIEKSEVNIRDYYIEFYLRKKPFGIKKYRFSFTLDEVVYFDEGDHYRIIVPNFYIPLEFRNS